MPRCRSALERADPLTPPARPMRPARRALLATLGTLGAATLAGASGTAIAQRPAAATAAGASGASDYDGPIRVLVGFPAGGATDTVARLLATSLRAALAQPVYVDNHPGAGGINAAQLLRAAPPDGSTVMLTIDHTHVIVPLTTRAPGYDPAADFTPLAGVAYYYNTLAVARSLRITDLSALGPWLRAHPDHARIGVPALGSIPQFAAFTLGKSMGLKVDVVPYTGGASLVADVASGNVPLGVAALGEFLPLHRQRKLTVLAVTGLKRAETAPDIPTFRELGLFDLDVNPWLAFFGPRGLPPAFAGRFTKAVATTLATPEIREKLLAMGNVPQYAPPGQLEHWVKTSTEHWRPIIQESGFEPR